MKRVLFAAAAMLMLAGCFNQNNNKDVSTPLPDETTAPDTPTPTPAAPVKGGTLRVPMRPPKTLNPLLNEDASVDTVLKLLFEPLIVLDKSFKPVPNLASFNFTSDGLGVTITLRDNLKWSDGTPITTGDIAFSLDTLRSAPDQAVYKNCVSNISAQYTILDDKKIKLQFLQPYSGMAYQFCFPIISKAYYGIQTDPGSAENMNPVGDGLYKFDSYDNLKEMQLSLNPYTYRQGPYINAIDVIIAPDQQTELNAFDQRLIDVVSAELAEWGRYRNKANTNIDEYSTMYYDFIGFNFNNETLAKLDVRQAVAHAVNIPDIIANIYLGHASMAFTPVNPDSWLFEPDVDKYDYNLDTATALVAKTGGYSGQPLRILVNKENDERVKIAGILNTNLNKIGLAATVESLDYAGYLDKLNSGDYDIFVGGFNLSPVPDLGFAFGSSEGAANMFSYKDDTMNALLAAAFSAIGTTSYQKSMSELQKYIAAQLPCVSLVFRKSAMLTSDGVLGDKFPVASNIFANINQWYIR